MWRWPETNTSFHSQPSVNQAVSNIQEGTRRLGTGRMQGRGGGTRIIRSDCLALLTMSYTPLCPQALLLLGLNPVSTSLQDQRCENLSLASNVSGESPLPLPLRMPGSHRVSFFGVVCMEKKDLELESVSERGLRLATSLGCGHKRQMCHSLTIPWATGEGPPGLATGL